VQDGVFQYALFEIDVDAGGNVAAVTERADVDRG
jgi:hypothetical protein